jgi:hypothetical protein
MWADSDWPLSRPRLTTKGGAIGIPAAGRHPPSYSAVRTAQYRGPALAFGFDGADGAIILSPTSFRQADGERSCEGKLTSHTDHNLFEGQIRLRGILEPRTLGCMEFQMAGRRSDRVCVVMCHLRLLRDICSHRHSGATFPGGLPVSKAKGMRDKGEKKERLAGDAQHKGSGSHPEG